MKLHNNLLKLLFGAIISIILVFFLLSWTSISEIRNSMFSFSLSILAASFMFYALSFLIRAIRFRFILNNAINLKDMLSIVCLHNFFNQIIPARLGELSYVYLIRKKGVPISKNISSIAIARLFDMLFVAIIFMIGVAATSAFISDRTHILSAITFFILSILLLISLISLKPLIFIRIIQRILKNRGKTLKLAGTHIEETLLEFKMLRSKHILLHIALSSALLWMSAFISTYLLISFLFPNITLFNTFFIGSIPAIISILPIHSFAGFGTTEAGFLFPLLLFGISRSDAVSAGFAVHIIFLVFLFFMAGIAYLNLSMSD